MDAGTENGTGGSVVDSARALGKAKKRLRPTIRIHAAFRGRHLPQGAVNLYPCLHPWRRPWRRPLAFHFSTVSSILAVKGAFSFDAGMRLCAV